MKVKQILIPTDFSHSNGAALEFASMLAAEAGAVLHIVHVDDMHDLNPPMAISGPYGSATELWDRSAVRARLDCILPSMADVQHTHYYLEGKPVDEITEYAERENIDLIVMGSHGRTGLRRLLMGSVAEAVMRKARCPILIIKQPSHEHVTADMTSCDLAE